MAPSSLQGLNIVHPPHQVHYGSDAHDLLSGPPFPDLSAQLDLWTNLAFESDEPLLKEQSRGTQDSEGLGEDKDEECEPQGIASADNHANVINPTIVPVPQHQPPAFDLGSILAGFGIDPFLVPPVNAPQTSQAAALAQLLSSYPPAPASYTPHLQQQGPESNVDTPANKRARTRKSSTASSISPSRDTTVPPGFGDDTSDISTPMTPAEDKRRRNTAASARFRLKKKEREAALEQKSKELEVRVGELERECEALRRENGWLKGLVVGVTGASAGATSMNKSGVGSKRRRDDLEHNLTDAPKDTALANTASSA